MMWHPAKISLLIILLSGIGGLVQAAEKIAPGGNNIIRTTIADINLLLGQRRINEAEILVKNHLKKYPQDVDYLILLAKVHNIKGDSTSAYETLEVARKTAAGYEDIYILQAALLANIQTEKSCRDLSALHDAYYENTPATMRADLEGLVASRKRGGVQVEGGIGYDELSNNRGVWRSAELLGRLTTCSGASIHAGYNSVERYQQSDHEYILGGGMQMELVGFEMEYRQSNATDILAQTTLSGTVTVGTGLSADLLMLLSKKQYDGIETGSAGLGVDYYIGNYQLMAIIEETDYLRHGEKLDSSQTQRFYLGYYFDKRKYLKYGYITGKELENDSSENPPYSKTKTVILSGAMPLSTKVTALVELKRHHQSGYYEQNGIRLVIRYSY